jgi:hypothetical protein
MSMRMPAGYPAAIKRGKKDEDDDDDLDRDRQDGQADLDSGLEKQPVQKLTTSAPESLSIGYPPLSGSDLLQVVVDLFLGL